LESSVANIAHPPNATSATSPNPNLRVLDRDAIASSFQTFAKPKTANDLYHSSPQAVNRKLQGVFGNFSLPTAALHRDAETQLGVTLKTP
jgi:hypothetical protein